MNRILPLTLLAAFAAPLLLVSPRAGAIDIKITNKNDPAVPCRLHMGTEPGDALQLDPNGAPGDLMVRGTFSPGDPCISGGGPTPAPTGTVALPPGTTPIADVPFNVNWTAQNAVACTFTGNGWSGDACGGTEPACNTGGSSGTKSVQLAAGSYDFGLTCTNGVDPAVVVADPVFVVSPTGSGTCGYGLPAGMQRQTVADVKFLTATAIFHQPMLRFGDLFGFASSCIPAAGGICLDVTPFPGLSGPAVQYTAENSKYIALEFTTAHVPFGKTSGELTVSPSNMVVSNTQWSISDRCGDFDPQGPFLSQHSKCLATSVAPKQGFGWSLVPSAWNCPLLNSAGVNDPNKVWYLNVRINSCSDGGGACRLMINNQ